LFYCVSFGSVHFSLPPRLRLDNDMVLLGTVNVIRVTQSVEHET